MPILQRVISVLSALPSFWVAWQLLNVWVRPASLADSEGWVRFGVALVVLELILLSSGAIGGIALGAARNKLQGALVALALVLFYGGFAWAVAHGSHSRQVLSIYGFVILARAVTVLVDGAAGVASILGRSVLGISIYMPLMAASALLPWPRFGLVGDLAHAAHTPETGGLWAEQPHRAIGAAFFYFLLLACLEVWLALKVERRPSE